MNFYALIETSTLIILLRSATLENLEGRIDSSYWDKRGMSKKGSGYSKEDYMKGKAIVKVVMERV